MTCRVRVGQKLWPRKWLWLYKNIFKFILCGHTWYIYHNSAKHKCPNKPSFPTNTIWLNWINNKIHEVSYNCCVYKNALNWVLVLPDLYIIPSSSSRVLLIQCSRKICCIHESINEEYVGRCTETMSVS
jgi:hypothetical protein